MSVVCRSIYVCDGAYSPAETLASAALAKARVLYQIVEVIRPCSSFHADERTDERTSQRVPAGGVSDVTGGVLACVRASARCTAIGSSLANAAGAWLGGPQRFVISSVTNSKTSARIRVCVCLCDIGVCVCV